MLRFFMCFISILVFAAPGVAKETTAVVTYAVKGASAAEIYDFIRSRAPRVAKNATFAFTVIATKTVHREAKAAASCRYTRFTTSAYYAFHLPRLSKSARLPPRTRANWASFAAYLKRHEESHRAIWRQCLADYDEQARALSSGTCDSLDAARERLFTRIKRACVQKDEAFDAQFRKDVRKQPFVVEATAGQ